MTEEFDEDVVFEVCMAEISPSRTCVRCFVTPRALRATLTYWFRANWLARGSSVS